MGFNLYIGEAVVRSEMDERLAWMAVDAMTVDGAPLNSTDNHSNCTFPSYSAWDAFARRTGLYAVFYSGSRGRDIYRWWTDDEGKDHEGLLSQHPGAFALTEGHYRAFVAARDRYELSLDPDESVAEYDRRRLNWLVWWTRWALDNCKYPTFYNS